MQLLISIDIGSSSTKGSLFEVISNNNNNNNKIQLDHLVSHTNSQTYYETTKTPPFTQNPHGWVNAALDVISQLCATSFLQNENSNSIIGITFTGAMQQLVLINNNDKDPPLPAIMYSDSITALPYAVQMQENGMSKTLEELTGSFKGGASIPAKLLYCVHNQLLPSNNDNNIPQRVLFASHSYVAYEFTGRQPDALCCDATTASTTGLLLSKSFQWVNLNEIGLLSDGPTRKKFLLPRLLGSNSTSMMIGRVFPTHFTKNRLPLKLIGVPVIHASGDLGCTFIGSSLIQPKIPHLYLGTSGWIALELPSTNSFPGFTPRKGFFLRHPLFPNQQQIFGIPTTSAGLNIVTWSRLLGCKSLQDFDVLASSSMSSPPTITDVLYLPHLLGERFPLDLPFAKGILFNMGPNVTQQSIARSILEGIAFQYRWGLESAAGNNETTLFKQIVFCGGGSNSHILAQELSRVLDATLFILTSPKDRKLDITLLGATVSALLALFESTHLKSIQDIQLISDGIEEIVNNNDSNIINQRYEIWKAMVNGLYNTNYSHNSKSSKL
jgi:xylulokinase